MFFLVGGGVVWLSIGPWVSEKLYIYIQLWSFQAHGKLKRNVFVKLKKRKRIFCLVSHGHSCLLALTKPHNPSVQIRSAQNLRRFSPRWIMAQLCVRDMSNVLAGSPKERNPAVWNNFFIWSNNACLPWLADPYLSWVVATCARQLQNSHPPPTGQRRCCVWVRW